MEDGLIKANPCTIKRAGKEDSPERPVLTMKQVFVLVDAIDPRFRMLILLATFGSLRWGELAALQRRNVDLEAGTIQVVGTTTERAALIYQHAAMERAGAIADALGKLAEEALKPEEPERDEQDPDGSGARNGRGRSKTAPKTIEARSGIHP
ncbi:hypothetical protein AB0J35_39785 [Nonomuraea angiospora]|uniref:hypothetical protein n=1 Tax=Nonomuraea angiospora TaxID=46172 RepID=UPI00341E3B70